MEDRGLEKPKGKRRVTVRVVRVCSASKNFETMVRETG
jgi:hypothetical protein